MSNTPEAGVGTPPPTPNVYVNVDRPHWGRRAAIAGGGILVVGALVASNLAGNGSRADGTARASGSVNHQTESWQNVSFECSNHVTELVGITGVQHNVVLAGLTSGGLKVNKDLATDFNVCSQENGVARVETDKTNDKVTAVKIHYTSSDFKIDQPRVDMLSPINRVPLRADDSLLTIKQKTADCAAKDADANQYNNCSDTGIGIMWPDLYQGKAFGFFGPKVTIPGPKVAVNPDVTLREATLMGETGQLATALDGTTIQRWNTAVQNIENTVLNRYAMQYKGLPVEVSMVPVTLPTEEQVVAQRLNNLAPDLRGLFTKADFHADTNDDTVLHVEAPGNSEMDVTLGDFKATPQTLASLNKVLAKYGIGAPTPVGNAS